LRGPSRNRTQDLSLWWSWPESNTLTTRPPSSILTRWRSFTSIASQKPTFYDFRLTIYSDPVSHHFAVQGQNDLAETCTCEWNKGGPLFGPGVWSIFYIFWKWCISVDFGAGMIFVSVHPDWRLGASWVNVSLFLICTELKVRENTVVNCTDIYMLRLLNFTFV